MFPIWPTIVCTPSSKFASDFVLKKTYLIPLIIFYLPTSLQNNRIWSISHNYFHFDPVHGDFDVGGQKFQWDDGIFSVTLGPRGADNSRQAYFHPMVSTNEFAINTRFLKSPEFASNITAQFKVSNTL